jgi:prephenate dehydratase
MLRVAYQGEPGAYSESAAIEYFGVEVETVPCESFDRVFEAVQMDQVERGILPIENSLAGSIHRNYDLLMRHTLWIVGEHDLHVEHCLISHPGVRLSDIRKVISHPQALAQCENHLRAMGDIEIAAEHDTAGSVRLLRAQGDLSVAAIASRRAAEVYGMAVLAENFEDEPANLTRFLIVACTPVKPKRRAKTSIVFTLNNQPGSLFKALSVFALREIDLTKIESRPLVGQPWEYLFYVDFCGSTEEGKVRRALDHLGEYAPMLRVLGSYPRKEAS